MQTPSAAKLARLTLVALAAMAFTVPAGACHRFYPDPENLERYSAVFLGEVTGIRRSGREYLLVECDWESPTQSPTDDPADELDCIEITDGAAPMMMYAFPLQVIAGKADDKIHEVEPVGCTRPWPALGDRGFIFLTGDGQNAITIWESDTKAFKQLAKRLGVHLPPKS